MLIARLTLLVVLFETGSMNALHGFSPQGTQMDYPSLDYPNSILTREVKIKQGRLRGVVRELKNRNLRNVEVYLGVPYAAPPVGNLRFMPPGSPPTWRSVRTFDSFGPVCPQTPPDLSHEPHKTMNAGRFNHLKGLLPFLGNQSEDCLYLNIYAPAQESSRVLHKYPVIVYIHGESFEWNSGNPYDGSVLASYGKVIVVTINFRLGILGFLKPGISGPTVSNFGLLDQIAALQWVKENIGEFGGDPSSVTLMGHGTGAACINFLMVSPVSMASDGLFHKAILMSGTALSDWALTVNPLQFTIQVAEALNCPLIEENDELSNCLRKKRLSEIMAVKVTVPEFQTPFGPVVDGSVVPNTPDQVMGIYQDLFTRYDLLFGMSEWESYHLLNAVSLTFGMLERERDQLLRQYMHSRFEVLPDFALATTLNEYLYWRKPLQGNQPAAMEHLDLVLDLLSDARVIAPMVQTGLYHAKINPKSYMYIFGHKSKFGEFAGSERSISGEEIPYAFGDPLLNGAGALSHFRFSPSEQLLSEFMLTHFTNFAKTGNPNAPRRTAYLTQGPREWQQYDVDWPEFDVKNQSFMSLGIPPHVDHRYRSPMTQFWNEELPSLLKNPTSIANKIKYPKPSVKQVYQTDVRGGFDAPRQGSTDPSVLREKQFESPPWTYGTIRTSPAEKDHEKKGFRAEEAEPGEKAEEGDRKEVSAGQGQSDHPRETSTEIATASAGSGNSMALTFFLIVGAAFLIINVFIFTLLYYKKKRLVLEERRLSRGPSGERSRRETRGCGRRFCDAVVRKKPEEEDEEDVEEEDDEDDEWGRRKMRRKSSASTMDPQSRVREWIQQGIFNKCGPGLYRGRKPSLQGENRNPVKPILKNPYEVDTLRRKGPSGVQKVSVAVDATPSTRGSSVLKQTPIEITKSLDRGLLSVGSDSDRQSADEDRSLRKSRTSVSLQMLPMESEAEGAVVPASEPTIIKIQHFPSKSDDGNCNYLETFIGKEPRDVNVTSREPEDPASKPIMQQEDMLRTIQRRNFPKVLPDLPTDLKRLSLPSSAHLQSLYWQQGKGGQRQNPPPPPPRVSTLDRKHRDEPKTITSSATINFKIPEDKTAEVDGQSTKRSQKATPKTVIVAANATPRAPKHPEPSIIIQPVIGPKSGREKTTPRVNLCSDNLPKRDPSGHHETKTDSTEDSSSSTKTSSTATIKRPKN